jgi:hypothetical protein
MHFANPTFLDVRPDWQTELDSGQQTHLDLTVPQPQQASSNVWHCAVQTVSSVSLGSKQLQKFEYATCANTVEPNSTSVVIPKLPRKIFIMEPFQLEEDQRRSNKL